MGKSMERFVWLGVMALGLLWLHGVARAALLDAPAPAALAKAFEATGPGWNSADTGYGGPADGNWSYALGGDASWSDYRANCRLRLVKPADKRNGMELGCFAYFHALADLGGYEAALVVRHESAKRHYRVAVSSLWKEVILWRPTGGVVQVQSYPFETGRTYELSVACQGPHISVSVNGKELIDWWDTADPVLKGQVGIARKEGESYFASVKVDALARQTRSAPPHRPQFREYKWHGYRYFFDGNEPLFVLSNKNILDHMKFLPGYRPIMYTFNHITDWNRFRPAKITESKVVETGRRLVLDVVAVDAETKSGIREATHLAVTYDAKSGMYVYDQTCTVDVPAEESDKVGKEWDHGDAVFLGGVGRSQTRDPDAFRALYQWSVFQADDGKYYKIPLNHNFHYLGKSSTNGGPLNPDGGIWVVLGDPIVSPVIKILGLPEGFSKVSCGHCWWAYDMHTMFHAKLVDDKVPAGQYVTKVRYMGMRAAEADKLLAAASFYQPDDLSVVIPVYTAGVGFTEPFDREVLLASPHQEHRIWAGVIDNTVGYDDNNSLRLDGPTEAWTITGSSYFMTGYGKKNLITAWVKTKNATGDGPTIGFRRWDNNYGEFYPTGITGTKDWTKIAFVTDGRFDFWGVTLYWRNAGTGTAWIDNFKVEPLAEEAVTDVPVGQHYPLNPKEPDVVLRWDGDGAPDGVLDGSGYGHHGKFYGGAGWQAEGGKRVIGLDGTGYVWPLCSPNLTLAPPCTMVFDLNPEGAGHLIYWGWNFSYSLTGGPPRLAVAYRLHGGKPVNSKPFLTAGEWQKLAIVAADGQVKLYRDGKFVETLPAKLLAGDWGLYCGSTWHRHFSFFGGGPGDMTLKKASPTGCLKGQVRSLTIYKRALTDQEIARLAHP